MTRNKSVSLESRNKKDRFQQSNVLNRRGFLSEQVSWSLLRHQGPAVHAAVVAGVGKDTQRDEGGRARRKLRQRIDAQHKPHTIRARAAFIGEDCNGAGYLGAFRCCRWGCAEL